MNEGINLLEPNKKKSPVWAKLNVMRIIVVGLLFVVSVSSVILFILVDLSPLPTLQIQEQSLQQSLSASKDDIAKLALVKERTDSITAFLSKRQMLDQTIGQIQETLSGNASVTAIQADSKGAQVTVESSSLQDINNFLNGLITLVQGKKFFSQVTLTNLTNDPTNNKYMVTIQVTSL